MTTSAALPLPHDALRAAACLPRLVVAVDFDGTLAPFVVDPADARAYPGTLDALRAIAATPGTTTALLSGRHRAGLAAASGVPDSAAEWGVALIGSHGAEWESGAAPLTDTESALRERIHERLRAIADEVPGVGLEVKPTAVVMHVRRIADPERAAATLQRAADGPGTLPGAIVTFGKAVVEIAVREASKGAALSRLREETGADAVIFFGDDVTDEKGFAVLGEAHGGAAEDVAVKVGDGDTAAAYRIADIPAVLDCLELLRDARTGADTPVTINDN